ncbi:single-stranded DNA-binding protein [Pasteurellaceae bacterium Pebbles2]|nr:single-stranded DNA-binding protein [Pasteurellaceae bacterium Pebbles2]
MSIYQKLAEARVKLQEKGLAQSGYNKFSGYKYFELKDFLPEANRIFNELKICGVVSFTKEFATLTIYDSESDGKIEFTSPMADANLKGCHDIQNLGAVETYQRRYLYVTALEISECDVLDENTGNPERTPKPQPNNVSQAKSVKSPPNSTSSTPPKTTWEKLQDGLKACKDRAELEALYAKQMPYLEEKYRELIDPYNTCYDEILFNLTH